MRMGAAPEIVDEGIGGFTATSLAELQQVVPKCFSLERRRIREIAENRFSASRMAASYAAAYEQVCRGRTP
jgi:hypothetical protein